MLANQIEFSNLEKRSVVIFFSLRSPNWGKFSRKCVISNEKHVIVKQIFKKRLNMSFFLRS